MSDPGACRRCGRTAKGSIAELFEAGWGDGGTLCPSCRAERNARAARTAGRIASGLADMYAERWTSGGRGNANAKRVEIRDLATDAVRAVYLVVDEKFEDHQDVWREIGDGNYLVDMSIAGYHQCHRRRARHGTDPRGRTPDAATARRRADRRRRSD